MSSSSPTRLYPSDESGGAGEDDKAGNRARGEGEGEGETNGEESGGRRWWPRSSRLTPSLGTVFLVELVIFYIIITTLVFPTGTRNSRDSQDPDKCQWCSTSYETMSLALPFDFQDAIMFSVTTIPAITLGLPPVEEAGAR